MYKLRLILLLLLFQSCQHKPEDTVTIRARVQTIGIDKFKRYSHFIVSVKDVSNSRRVYRFDTREIYYGVGDTINYEVSRCKTCGKFHL